MSISKPPPAPPSSSASPSLSRNNTRPLTGARPPPRPPLPPPEPVPSPRERTPVGNPRSDLVGYESPRQGAGPPRPPPPPPQQSGSPNGYVSVVLQPAPSRNKLNLVFYRLTHPFRRATSHKVRRLRPCSRHDQARSAVRRRDPHLPPAHRCRRRLFLRHDRARCKACRKEFRSQHPLDRSRSTRTASKDPRRAPLPLHTPRLSQRTEHRFWELCRSAKEARPPRPGSRHHRRRLVTPVHRGTSSLQP